MLSSQIPDWPALGLNACYELSLELQSSGQRYGGTARVTFANLTSSPLPDLVFRLYPNAPDIYGGALQIDKATVDGAAASPMDFLPDHTAVRLPLAQPLKPGATTVVELSFDGRVPVDFGQGVTYGIFNYDTSEQLLTLTNWFPMLAVPLDGTWDARAVLAEGDAVVSQSALYRVRITAPVDWKLAATGSLVDSQTRAGTAHYDFVTGPVRDFSLVASPSFETQETQVDGVRVVHWGLPDGEANWQQVLDVARGSLAIFDRRFGQYPYAELDVVALPLQNASGVEYPGLIMIGARLYSGEDAERSLPVTVAHEVAHQWWYGVVGSDVLQSPWQDEGLTTFSSTLYFEKNSPPFYEGLLDYYRQRLSDFKQDQADEPIAQPVAAFRGRGGAYGTIVYTKAALFFEALREQVGDDAFFGALQDYFTGNRYQLVAPDALLSAFERRCGCDLSGLYQEWGVETP